MYSYNPLTDQFYIHAKTVVETFREHNIKSDFFYIAENHSYGMVDAWEMSDGKYVIEFKNNGYSDYVISENIDDLPFWLENPSLDGIDRVIQAANVRGIKAVETTPDDSKDIYVLITRHWYGPSSSTDVVRNYDGDPIVFDDEKSAQWWIDDASSGPYHTSHNEIGTPTYTIVYV